MKHNAFFLAARLPLIFHSPRKRAIPQRLRITLFQTHSRIEKNIKIRKLSGTRPKSQLLCRRFK
jgi:hypothetical protein